jgi:hypothetical protein
MKALGPDGRVTAAERNRLNMALDRLARERRQARRKPAPRAKVDECRAHSGPTPSDPPVRFKAGTRCPECHAQDSAMGGR